MRIEFSNSIGKALLRNAASVGNIIETLDSLTSGRINSKSLEKDLVKNSLEVALSGQDVDLDFIKMGPISDHEIFIQVDPDALEEIIDSVGNYTQQIVGPMFQIAIAARTLITSIPEITTRHRD